MVHKGRWWWWCKHRSDLSTLYPGTIYVWHIMQCVRSRRRRDVMQGPARAAFPALLPQVLDHLAGIGGCVHAAGPPGPAGATCWGTCCGPACASLKIPPHESASFQYQVSSLLLSPLLFFFFDHHPGPNPPSPPSSLPPPEVGLSILRPHLFFVQAVVPLHVRRASSGAARPLRALTMAPPTAPLNLDVEAISGICGYVSRSL